MESQDVKDVPVNSPELHKMELDGLTLEFCKLWPRLEQQELPVAEVCYFIHKKLKIKGKRRAGIGIKQWCADHGIKLHRFNYLVDKGMPDDEREKKERKEMQGRISDAAKEPVCRQSTNSSPSLSFETAWESVKRCLQNLPTTEELEKHRVIEHWLGERVLKLRYQTRTPLVSPNSNAPAAIPISGISHKEAQHGEQAS
jgi:hypothetical protein